MRFVIAEDDQDMLMLLEMTLKSGGHEVEGFTTGAEALDCIKNNPPDVAILDIMMADLDGLEVLRKLRADSNLSSLKIAVHSGKNFDFDRRRALSYGADAFLPKGQFPPDELMKRLEALGKDQLSLHFWGARGTLPVPGPGSLKYGGNTACVSLRFPSGALFIFDAGTGIKRLSDHILSSGMLPLQAKIFITHPHWDHINALPFFVPLYIPGNKFEILASAQGDIGVEQMIADQMDCIYFPITPEEFGAHVRYTELDEGDHVVADIQVSAMKLCHPGNCLGYRVEHSGIRFCYITDNELFFPDTSMYSEAYYNQLVEFIHGADVLITDACYTDAEYPKKVTWGHSCVSQVARLAAKAQVKKLFLYHHDPSQNDDAIEKKVEDAQNLLAELGASTECLAPIEGDEYVLHPPKK